MGNLNNKDQCGTFGFVIGVKNEEDQEDCHTRIISSVDCEELRNVGLPLIGLSLNISMSSCIFQMTTDVFKCSTKIVRLMFDKQVSSRELFFDGSFRFRNKYRTTVWRITEGFDEIASITKLAGNIDGWICFKDLDIINRYWVTLGHRVTCIK